MTRVVAVVAALVGVGAGGATQPAVAQESEVLVVKAKRVHTAAGAPIENGVVIVRAGKIEAIGADLSVPDGAKVLEFSGGVVTPGLIDACCLVEFEIPVQWSPSRNFDPGARRETPPPPEATKSLWSELIKSGEDWHSHDPAEDCSPACAGPRSQAEFEEMLAAGPSASLTWAEHSAEVIPHRHVLDSVNLLSNDFRRLLRSGVTTVFVSPDSASVIGARGAIVKTAGPMDKRIVRRADAVKAAMGADPSRRGRANMLPPLRGPAPTVYTRRPTTRMGVDWVFRKAFYDARRAAEGLTIGGADAPPTEALPVLQQLLAGEIPLRIQARKQHDIFSALRLAGEFGLKFTLEEATEAYRCLPELKAAGVPVIYGPIFDSAQGYRLFSREVDDPRLNTAKQLHDAGIAFALTAQDMRDEEGLAQQAMYAVRYGLPRAQALQAITAAPAKLMGLEPLGTLVPGAAADLVVWSGEPFEATSATQIVIVDGMVAYEAN